MTTVFRNHCLHQYFCFDILQMNKQIHFRGPTSVKKLKCDTEEFKGGAH